MLPKSFAVLRAVLEYSGAFCDSLSLRAAVSSMLQWARKTNFSCGKPFSVVSGVFCVEKLLCSLLHVLKNVLLMCCLLVPLQPLGGLQLNHAGDTLLATPQ